MPVWHEATKSLRESGELVVVGITQEQHPDRCRLYAQWQEFEWPILWDPFNLTGSSAVPIVLAVDEHGIVRAKRLRPDDLSRVLLEPEFEAPSDPEEYPADVRPELLADGPGAGHGAALAQLLFQRHGDKDAAVETLEQLAGGLVAEEASADWPALFFHLGVAYRMRYDSQAPRASDFQSAVDAWGRALALDPNQYIWRRRIQQYGPRLDKPYPFYDWIEGAEAKLRERGEEPWPVRVRLSGAEIADKTNALPANPGEHRSPDPKRKVDLDGEGLLRIETGTVRHTGKQGAIVRAAAATRVHVALRPDAEKEVHWTNDAGPAVVWIAVPRGWRIERNLYDLAPPADAKVTSSETRAIDFEVVPGPEASEGPTHLIGYALYYVCEGEEGRCVYRRQDFEIPLELPPERPR